MPAATAATPSSASPRPAPSSASTSGTTSARDLQSQAAHRSHTCPNSSRPNAGRPDSLGFCPSYVAQLQAQAFVGVKLSRLGNQPVGELRVNAPIARLV